MIMIFYLFNLAITCYVIRYFIRYYIVVLLVLSCDHNGKRKGTIGSSPVFLFQIIPPT